MLFSFAALNDYNEGDGEGAREGRVTFPLLKEERSVAHTRAHVMYFASLDLVLHALIWGAGGVTQSARPLHSPDLKALPSLESAHTSRLAPSDYKELSMSYAPK